MAQTDKIQSRLIILEENLTAIYNLIDIIKGISGNGATDS